MGPVIFRKTVAMLLMRLQEILVNPLYSDGFSYTYWYNKYIETISLGLSILYFRGHR